ncbi:hypothetical protein C7212DRAFT_315806, partial [Tuber magnatum]
MVRTAWLTLLFMLFCALVQGAVEAALIGRDRVEHVGRVMSYGLDPRGERNSNRLTGWVRAGTKEDAQSKG